ncbi:hypothetical protein [Actinomycetospora soli]|uniref:hypothetical protein n=1 Tax=Actinomycetospora soli TaxID=2893887 RepID=UPI001E3A4944|nr:hypothetical protein [Actinomycetospora soli]MCD2191021.1 hypothetical protein [Actinomycetospora soli]
MSDPAQRAANLEQQYVDEYEDTEQALTGLDPDKDERDQSKDRIEAVAKDSEAEEHVETMADEDR